ncbi:uncharacterized protein LOC110239067, partial [Exaiptasia diaphana]|uniref:Uncharacterized protein n=1 Tax=Exaiptasia diaphana TaxID=2652724 RepID=A0A913X814_EXADI
MRNGKLVGLGRTSSGMSILGILLQVILSYIAPSSGDPYCNEPLVISESSTFQSPSRRGSNYQPSNGKLFNSNVWCAAEPAADQYLQVNFKSVKMIESIAIQGNPNENEFVKYFTLRYSHDNVKWLWYEEPKGIGRVFKGSVNRELVARNTLERVLAAQYVRFYPKTWYGSVCMRVELYGCEANPFTPLGMANGEIQNGAIKASSHHASPHLPPHYGRLHGIILEGYQAWGSAHDQVNQEQWLEIGLIDIKWISGVATQGRHNVAQWVTSYSLIYGNSHGQWTTYKHDGSNKLIGNNDADTVVRHQIIPAIFARYVRFVPVTWHSHISMRVEVYTFGKASPADLGIDFERQEMPNSGLTASSSWTGRQPYMARLNYPGIYPWCSNHTNHNLRHEWLQFDFGCVMLVTGIVTQGARNGGTERKVTRYQVSFSEDNKTWRFYLDEKTHQNKTFEGNKDISGYVTHHFRDDIEAQYLRIHIMAYEPTGSVPCMRASVLGRRNGPLCAPVFMDSSPSVVIGYEGDNVTLNCNAIGALTMKFNWYFKKNKMNNAPKVYVYNKVTKQRAGKHTCQVSNSVQASEKVVYLKIKDSTAVCEDYRTLYVANALKSVETKANDQNLNHEIDEDVWYRFKDTEGNDYRLATTCVPQNHCGAEITVFQKNDNLPTFSKGIVARWACFHRNGDCCHHQEGIFIRNCNHFYVYKLKKLDESLKASYCLEKYTHVAAP